MMNDKEFDIRLGELAREVDAFKQIVKDQERLIQRLSSPADTVTRYKEPTPCDYDQSRES